MIANIASIAFLYEAKPTFIVYPFDSQDASGLRTKKSVQRYERCLLHLRILAPSASNSFLATFFYDKLIQSQAEEFAKEVIKDVIEKIKDKIGIDADAKKYLIDKLEKIKVVAMFSDEILNEDLIEEIYKDFNINGSESLLEMFGALKIFNKKLLTAKTSNWKKQVNIVASKSRIEHVAEHDLLGKKICLEKHSLMFLNIYYLVIPAHHVLLPSYHPNRPRFFNTATFYFSVADVLLESVKSYLKKVCWNN